MLSAFTLALSLLSSVALVDARKCNGYEELCDRKYSNVTMVGSHNSAFVGTFEIPLVGSFPANNQGWTVREQLDNGIRFMTAQTHWDTKIPTADIPVKRSAEPWDIGGFFSDVADTVTSTVDDTAEKAKEAAEAAKEKTEELAAEAKKKAEEVTAAAKEKAEEAAAAAKKKAEEIAAAAKEKEEEAAEKVKEAAAAAKKKAAEVAAAAEQTTKQLVGDVKSVTDDPKNTVSSVVDLVGGDEGLKVCHTACLLRDAGWLKDYLKIIKSWLDDNPDEVFTLLLTNPDRRDVTEFDAIFKAIGLDTYTYVPPTSPGKIEIQQWPTLGQLIDDDTRLIVFMDYHVDEESVPYILSEFNYFFETIFDTTDETFTSCEINRPADKNPEGKMALVNHYLDVDLALGDDYELLIPKFTDTGKVNAVDGTSGIATQARSCAELYGRYPKVMLLDYVNKGKPFEAEDVLNGLAG